MLVLFPRSLSQAATANQKTVASGQASDILGEITQIGADALYHDQIPYDLIRQSAEKGPYQVTTTSQRVGSNPDSKLQRVTVTVTFGNGTTETYSTYVVNP